MGQSARSGSASRRTSLIKSASKRLSDLSRPLSRKERLADDKDSRGIKISPPFNFRDLNNSSSSSDVDLTSAKKGAGADIRRASVRSPFSPQEKPLPSLPIATYTTNAPSSARRSLIDAQEKPLRRSVSPKQQTLEDWPSLSPKKQRSADGTSKVKTPIKPSVSDGLAERIRNLNLSDVAQHKADLSTGRPSLPQLSSLPTTSNHSKLPTPAIKSPTFAVRQNKASELRLRLSASSLDTSKIKKTSLSSPLADISGNVAIRARPQQRVVESKRRRTDANRSRSRSRHCVTAEGSPYVLPVKETNNSPRVPTHDDSLVLDASKVDTNFGNDGVHSRDSAVAAALLSQHGSMNDCKSLNPTTVLETVVRPLDRVQAGENVNVPSIKPAGSNHESRGSTEVDQGSVLLTITDDTILDQAECASHSSTAVESVVHEQSANGFVREQTMSRGTNDSNEMADNKVNPLWDEVSSPANGHYQVDSTSPDSVQPGASVKRIISNDKDFNTFTKRCGKVGNTSEVLHSVDAMHEHSTLASVHQHEPEQEFALDRDVSDDQVCSTSRDGLRQASESHSIPRKPIANSSAASRSDVLDASTMSAPLVRPGTPIDDTYTGAWPFKESIVAPFKTSITPERTNGRALLDLTASRQKRSSLPEISPGHSTHSGRYDVKQALRYIEPLERSTKSQSAPRIDEKGTPSAFPARTSSRHAAHTRTTGHRTRSAQGPVLAFGIAPDGRHQGKAPNSVPRPQHMKSFNHSTQNLHSVNDNIYQGKNKPLPSPLPPTGSVSTGKVVIKNIRGLFHKRSNMHNSIYGSLHNPLRRSKSKHLAKQSSVALDINAIPSEYSVTSVSQGRSMISPAAYHAPRSTPRTFPTNRVIRPFASSSPVSEEEHSLLAEDTQVDQHKVEEPHQPMSAGPAIASSAEPEELQSATQLVHHLLELIQHHDIHGTMQAQMLEMSKLLVSLLSSARDAEKAREQANIAASTCAIQCVQVRRDIKMIEELVRGLLDDLH